MAKKGFLHIPVSLPRLIVAAVLVGVLIGGTQLLPRSSQTHPLQSQTAASQQGVPFTAAPQSASQTAPKPTPQVATPTPKPVVAVTVTHTAKPAPVVKTAPSASVTGLHPVDPTAPSGNTGGSSSGSSPASTPTTKAYTSTNWSGYLATSPTSTPVLYTGVSGSWTAPVATGSTRQSTSDATWIGIGGVSSADLIQVGTQDTVSRTGVETSSAFYEMLPDASKTIASMHVSPGDSITASLVEVSSGQWTISIADTTSGSNYTATVSYSSSHSSAEWIEEDPSYASGSLVPFDDFGTVSFNGATATTSAGSLSLSATNAQPITMVSSTDSVIASPSAIGVDGKSFNVTHE